MIDGETVVGESVYEEICSECIPPSAKYDYTKDVVEGKATEDIGYMEFNPINFYELLKRDIGAPDNKKTHQDLEVLEVVSYRALNRVRGTNQNGFLGAKKGSTKNSKHKNQDARDAASQQ